MYVKNINLLQQGGWLCVSLKTYVYAAFKWYRIDCKEKPSIGRKIACGIVWLFEMDQVTEKIYIKKIMLN